MSKVQSLRAGVNPKKRWRKQERPHLPPFTNLGQYLSHFKFEQSLSMSRNQASEEETSCLT